VLPKSTAGTAIALGKDLRRLTKAVIEQLHDPELVGDAGLEGSIAGLLDCLCVSMSRSKVVGLNNWAAREGARLGAARASELAAAAVHVVASEAARFPIDHGRTLAFLEILRSTIDSALASCDDDAIAESDEFNESTRSLLAMLGERDAATCCHSRATGEWTRRLCAAMAMPAESAALTKLCAVLHDIGKISTPDTILQKRGPLTEDEWVVMRDHSAAGQRILDQIPTLSRCALIVRAHHERWDGAGYPDGLAGENIPIEARVVAVADAFHAMISDRPYRKAIAPRRALEILKAGRGTQWDPAIVDSMLGLFAGALGTHAQARASTA
jgi:putative nucleotidyltransferase with HDIG domain